MGCKAYSTHINEVIVITSNYNQSIKDIEKHGNLFVVVNDFRK